MDIDRTQTENLIQDGKVTTAKGETLSNCFVLDNGYVIEGLTENGEKARYNSVTKKTYYGKDIARANIITMDCRPKEELLEFQRKSMEIKQANKEKKKTFNELARAMLEQTLNEKQIQEILGTGTSMLLDNSVGSVMLGKMIQGAMEGSFKCAEFVRDTAGYRPRNEIELQADIITESDRALLDKLTDAI